MKLSCEIYYSCSQTCMSLYQLPYSQNKVRVKALKSRSPALITAITDHSIICLSVPDILFTLCVLTDDEGSSSLTIDVLNTANFSVMQLIQWVLL